MKRSDAESGKIKVGCLLSLVFVIAVLYYGIDYVGMRVKAYQMQDQVTEQASFAAVVDDVTIRRRLVETADRLGLPLGPRQWDIRRVRVPQGRRVTIRATYTDSVVIALPGIRKVIRVTFTPSADQIF